MTARYPLWIDGQWRETSQRMEIHSPFDGKVVALADQADSALMDEALEAASHAYYQFRRISRYTRARLLAGIAQEISNRRAEFTEKLVSEAGKPYGLADGEIGRAIQTFTIAAEETKRWGGEVVPVDLDAAGRAYLPAVSLWFPRGPVLAIAPFNFPLNLIAHKVAPALAVGTSVVIKPPPQAPGAAKLLAEVFEKVRKEVSDSRDEVPAGALQVVNGSNEVIERAVTDSRISILSFTGSDKVGWMLQTKAVKKKVILELGGNAAVVVHSDADLARAAARCAFGGFAYAGQVCISVQRILVHENVAKDFQDLFMKETAKLGVGDPARKDTVVGPLINPAATERVMSWIEESKKDGAKVIAGGTRDGQVITPAILTGVQPEHKLYAEEVFGPVVVAQTYKDFPEAMMKVNDSRFGLQAGVFTQNSSLVQHAVQELDVGGIMVNEIPTYRADNMPYGGTKESGLGREGVRYTMEEYCERKTVVQWMG